MTTAGKEEPEPGAGQQKQLGLPMPHRQQVVHEQLVDFSDKPGQGNVKQLGDTNTPHAPGRAESSAGQEKSEEVASSAGV